MIGQIVRIGRGPSDLMRVERCLPDRSRFYGTACRGGPTGAAAAQIALATREDIATWQAWAESRDDGNPRRGVRTVGRA